MPKETYFEIPQYFKATNKSRTHTHKCLSIYWSLLVQASCQIFRMFYCLQRLFRPHVFPKMTLTLQSSPFFFNPCCLSVTPRPPSRPASHSSDGQTKQQEQDRPLPIHLVLDWFNSPSENFDFPFKMLRKLSLFWFILFVSKNYVSFIHSKRKGMFSLNLKKFEASMVKGTRP